MLITNNSQRLFLACRIALLATAMTFAIRANLIGPLGNTFGLRPNEMGLVFGTAFWGFTLSMILGGYLCDLFGMKRLLFLAFTGHVTGILLTIGATGFWSLFFSTLLIGIANGLVEAACNPLVASLYPNEKTKRLNQLHVWFPGGIVIGGLIAYCLDKMQASWHWQVASILMPTVLYGILFLREKFPETERVSSGITTKEMVQECKKPLFIFMTICMMFTAATELGTNQWIAELLGNVGVPAILLLVFINGLMALGRSFAGPIEKKLSAPGMLLFSAIVSAVGLTMLSHSVGYFSFISAAIFATGICFFWPTMLGFVSENLPKSGALGLAIMGGSGMLSVSLILPFIGDVYALQTQLHLPAGHTLQEASDVVTKAKMAGGQATLAWVSILPLLLSVAFFIAFRKRIHTNQRSNKFTL
jgi:MFS family permease